jgi:nitroreductase
MEFRDVVGLRRMHRSFLPEPIEAEQVDRILETIRHAPSAGFSQGCSIVAVTDPNVRGEIARRFEPRNTFIGDAPVLLVIAVSEAAYHARYTEADKFVETGGVKKAWPVPYWYVDAGALMMLVLMAAIDEGLASAFVSHDEQRQIFAELLDLPDDVIPIGVVLVGRPGGGDDPGSRVKARHRPLSALVHRERWGNSQVTTEPATT